MERRKLGDSVVLIGSAFVGKTTLVNALHDAPVDASYAPTQGASLVRVRFQDGKETRLFDILDRAGMEKYRSLAPIYYRDSKAAIVVFDVANQESFESVDTWITEYRNTAGENTPVIIVGNKIDLPRVVSTENGRAHAALGKHAYLEVSALKKDGIDAILPLLNKVVPRSLSVEEYETANGQGGCC